MSETEREPISDEDRHERAAEAAREIVTLLKLAEEQGSSADAHVAGIVREQTRGWKQPREFWALIEVLALAVAGTFEDLSEWSAHVVAALATGSDDDDE